MRKYTHIFHERGNGFPAVGEEVLVERSSGWHEIKKVAEISSIHTRQYASNYVYLALSDADRDYGELDEEEAKDAWENLHHVEIF